MTRKIRQPGKGKVRFVHACRCGGMGEAWWKDGKPVLHERGAWACVHYHEMRRRQRGEA